VLGLAIACFVGSALLLALAFRPQLMFYISQGRKFRQRLQPSGLYMGLSTVSCLIVALVLAVIGTVVLAKSFTDAPKNAARNRCAALERAFNGTIEWSSGRVANPDTVQDLAHTFNVEVTIVSSPAGYDGVAVNDAADPPPQQSLFGYSGDSTPTPGTCP
jgi:hypothetical protein